MALLHNPNQTLRLQLQLVDRAQPARGPQTAPTPPRLIGTASVEFFDRRDRDFIPMLQLPVLHLEPDDGEALVTALRELTSGARGGFSFRTGAAQELTLQFGKQPEGFVVEVGVDLGPWLKETSGVSAPEGEQLALFRFPATLAELVSFAGGLHQELLQLPPGPAQR